MLLLGLASLGAEGLRGGAAVLEVAGEDWLEEGAEHDLGAPAAESAAVRMNNDLSGMGTYWVWGRAIHRTRTNLKV